MNYDEPEFTVGIEEEYLLVDRHSRDLIQEPPDEFFSQCESRLKGQVRPEFLKSQIEVGTTVCRTIGEARRELGWLRGEISSIAEKFDAAPIAAATHPFAQWQSQVHTDKERYHMLAEDMQAVARRLIICGMHVHVGVADNELRVDLMNQVAYFLPHLLALSTSSPFWRGENTGLKSYRLAIFDELPRTGLPERFDSYEEYLRHVDVLVRSGLIADATMLWWDVRPSATFPTLELRIPDICTRLEDAISIAAIYVCVIRMLYRLRRDNQRWRSYLRMLINENRWRAQRYGFAEGLVDFGKGAIIPFVDLLDELLDLICEDAAALNCETEIEHSRKILSRGTSADRQIECYDNERANGKDKAGALRSVVDFLIDETVLDI